MVPPSKCACPDDRLVYRRLTRGRRSDYPGPLDVRVTCSACGSTADGFGAGERAARLDARRKLRDRNGE